MKYFSMFSGIGTGEKGIEQAYDIAATEGQQSRLSAPERLHAHAKSVAMAGQQPACVGFCEIDRHAEAIYRYHYPGHRNYGDATRIVPDELPDFDFLIAGFPCQAFSIAGKRLGFEDTRGTLFFEIARILREKRPSHFLLENVAGLLSHDDGNTFRTIVSTLIEIGYDLEWTVINSKDHGVPQNRERVFIIGHPRDGRCGEVFSLGDGDGGIVERSEQAAIANCFTAGGNSGGMHSSMTLLETARTDRSGGRGSTSEKHRWDVITVASRGRPREGVNVQQLEPRSDGLTNTITSVEKDNLVMQLNPSRESGGKQPYQQNRIYSPQGHSPALPAQLSTGFHQILDRRIRRLTPVECERLQGLPDGYTAFGRYGDEIREVADTNRYKGLGNAFTVNVIEAIIRAMRERGCLE